MITTVRSGQETSMLDAAYAAIAEEVARGGLASGVLAVASADQVQRLEAFGPVTTDSIFLLASITKPIFATSLMRLVERGAVLLNDPVANVIPEFAANGKANVRLWHLLTHTCAASLTFAPGTRYAYCNPSFIIMGEMVKRLTGIDHAQHLTEAVLEPLQMHDTCFIPRHGDERIVPVLDPPWRNEQERAGWLGLRHPAAGLWSTAADLVRFGQALLRDGELDGYQLLAPASLRAMTTLQTSGIPSVTGEGEFQSYYGLGFSKAGPRGERGPSAELRSPGGFGHGGATGTYLWVEPEFDLVFVFLSNRWLQDDRALKRALNAAIAAASV
jgi:serine-type D-Ala-D-Ala carboxypeptidase